MEPMVEIFLEETRGILLEMKEHIERGRSSGRFEHEQINDIFRYIHTLKANSAMMLYDNIAGPAKELEKVLYYFRDQADGVDESRTDGFLALMYENLSFYEGEIQKLMEGSRADGDSTELTEHILSYLSALKEGNPPEKSFSMKKPEKEQEQFFYISSGSESTSETNSRSKSWDADAGRENNGSFSEKKQDNKKKDGETSSERKTERKQASLYVPESNLMKRPKYILVSSDELDHLDNINVKLLKFANTMGAEAKVLLRELDNWLWRVHSTDFTMMAAKLDRTVKDMLQHLDRQVSFHVAGSKMTIERSKIDKISNAMIHLVRNAVDHGIETPKERMECGKKRCGYVNVDIEEMEEHSGLRIRLSDDGRGMDMYQILDKAGQKGMLSKPYEEYTEREAFDLIFQPGFTTRDNAGEYSGRGVGMDVVRHSLMEIGGTIRVESVLGVGTSFILEIAYDSSASSNDDAKRRALIDESINSRR